MLRAKSGGWGYWHRSALLGLHPVLGRRLSRYRWVGLKRLPAIPSLNAVGCRAGKLSGLCWAQRPTVCRVGRLSGCCRARKLTVCRAG